MVGPEGPGNEASASGGHRKAVIAGACKLAAILRAQSRDALPVKGGLCLPMKRPDADAAETYLTQSLELSRHQRGAERPDCRPSNSARVAVWGASAAFGL